VQKKLLPIIKPQVLIIDLVQDNIATAGQSYAGYPKPYFTVENSRLVLHNNPVPRYEPRDDPFELLKNFASYSLMIDRVMATYFPNAWYSSRTQNFTRANNDEVNVTCLLLLRLKKEVDTAGVRLLITMQYGPGTITSGSRPDGSVRLVEECIEGMGIELVDEFSALKELSQNHSDEFKALYVSQPNGLLGHKSRAGNLQLPKRPRRRWRSRLRPADPLSRRLSRRFVNRDKQAKSSSAPTIWPHASSQTRSPRLSPRHQPQRLASTESSQPVTAGNITS
jgi:hypothetical protein